MFQLKLEVTLTRLDAPKMKPLHNQLVLSGSTLDDLNMLMTDRGPAGAFFNAVDRVLMDGRKLDVDLPEPPADEATGTEDDGTKEPANAATKKKTKAGKGGAVGANVEPAAADGGQAPVAEPAA